MSSEPAAVTARPRVYIPYIPGWLRPETTRACYDSRLPVRHVQLDPLDDRGYGRLVRRLWGEGAGFIICEHDIIPTADQLQDLAGCARPWCYFEYDDHLYPPGPMFGLCKFSAQVIADHPLAAEVALVIGKRRDEEAPWWHCDSLIARDLMIRGVDAHRHDPPVRHTHTGPPSGPPV